MTACTIKTDLSGLFCESNERERNGKKYWKLQYEIELAFGGPELEARLKWVEKVFFTRSEHLKNIHFFFFIKGKTK